MIIPTTSTTTIMATTTSSESSQTESPELAAAKSRVEKDETEVDRANRWLLILLAVYLASNFGIAGVTLWIYRANKRLRASDGIVSSLYQERAAIAEQSLSEVRQHQKQRFLDVKKFLAALKDKPKGTADILYPSEDEESRILAWYIRYSLGQGEGNAGWIVSDPHPLTVNERLWPGDAPLYINAGAWYGLAIQANEKESRSISMFNWTTALGALWLALSEGTDTPPVVTVDARLPDNSCRIVVGPRPALIH